MPPVGNLYPNSGILPKRVENPRAAGWKSLPKSGKPAEKGRDSSPRPPEISTQTTKNPEKGRNFPTAQPSCRQRAIPYIPNESAYHHGTFDNTHYFDIIDCIKNENIAELNKISPQKVYEEDFNELVKAYKNYRESAAKAVKGLGEDIDYTYGLQGFAESWLDMEGGATQYVTPLSGSWLETFGILKEIK